MRDKNDGFLQEFGMLNFFLFLFPVLFSSATCYLSVCVYVCV